LITCPDLAGLDEASLGSLFWLGEGSVIYAEDTLPDNTFPILETVSL